LAVQLPPGQRDLFTYIWLRNAAVKYAPPERTQNVIGDGELIQSHVFRGSIVPQVLPAWVTCPILLASNISEGITMRLLVLLVAAAGIFSADARSQEALKLCQVIKDDGERLKCYDAALAGAQGTKSADTGQEREWSIAVKRSPLDDSAMITALMSGSTDRSGLMLRCQDGETEVAIVPESFVQCGGDPVRVIYRIDQGQPIDEANWTQASSCGGVLSPAPIPFIRSLNDKGKLFVRVFERRGASHDAVFDLGAVSGVRSRLAEVCRWDAKAQTETGTKPAPPPNAPAPAVKGQPKAPR
jgi:Type VI secretion system VasI, EvfG, VC_A0118